VVNFLLNVRFVYDETMSGNLRFVANCFVVAIVGINRIVARDDSKESWLYVFALIAAIGLYTFAFTDFYGGGSVAGGFLNSPYAATFFNMTLAAFLWWVTNRLVHECCVDENRTAGDIGIFTGTARKWLERAKQQPKPVGDEEDLVKAVDPSAWKEPEPKPRPTVGEPSRRLAKRHAGISVFYFSIPAMLVFILGQRVVLHDRSLTLSGHVYFILYVASALSLLMLTSLGGLRQYFRSRHIHLPAGIGPFWAGLGFVMVLMVLFGAAAFPSPSRPAPAAIEEHRYDPYAGDYSFKLQPVEAGPAELARQSAVVRYIGRGVLVVFALFLLYGAVRGVAGLAAEIARHRHEYPGWVVRLFDAVERFLTRIAQLPKLPRPKRLYRVRPNVSLAARHRNPMLVDSEQGRTSDARDLIQASYDALCALAEDLGVPRAIDQTPYEFIDSLPEPLETLRPEAVELTRLYVRASYSPFPMDPGVEDRLRRFWTVYERVRSRVVF